MRILSTLLGISLVLGAAANCSADLILEYTFTGETFSPTYSQTGLTFTSDFQYVGVGNVAFRADSGDPNVLTLPPSGDPQVIAGGWSSDSTDSAYYSFTVGKASGIDIDSLSFWAYAGNGDGNDLEYRVDASAGGGSFQTVGSGVIPPSNANTDYLLQEIPLSIANETANIEFRLYGLNYTPNSSFRIDCQVLL
jgi:hypothetical protein